MVKRIPGREAWLSGVALPRVLEALVSISALGKEKEKQNLYSPGRHDV